MRGNRVVCSIHPLFLPTTTSGKSFPEDDRPAYHIRKLLLSTVLFRLTRPFATTVR